MQSTATCRVHGEEVSTVGGEFVSVWEDNDYFVCSWCLAGHSGPGSFEGNGDALGLALVLDALSMDSSEDHFLTDDYSGHIGQFGRHLLRTDERGFVSAESYADVAAALNEINSYEDDGFGAQPDDGWISYERHGITASLGGKSLGTFERLSRAKAAVSVEMRKTGYYPNVFLAGEHGPTVRRIDVW